MAEPDRWRDHRPARPDARRPRRQRQKTLTERFDLDTSKKARAYSRGNRQKVALVAALSSDAELLLLDEPTAGLDPLMEATFRECITEERHEGRAVLLSSHVLAEVEALSDRVTIIRDGRAVETGTLDELRHLTRDRGRRRTGGAGRPGRRAGGARPEVTDGRGCAAGWTTARWTRCGPAAPGGIRTLTCRPPTLEELFLRHYSRPNGPWPERRDDQPPGGALTA